MNIGKQDIVKKSKIIRKEKDKAKKDYQKGKIKEKVNTKNSQIIIPQIIINNKVDKELLNDKWYFNGFVINLDGDLIIVDPGVDFYTRFILNGLKVNQIRAIIISHKHIDHIYSLPFLIEKCARNQSKITNIYLPKDAYKKEVTSYYKNILKKNKNLKVNLIKGKLKNYFILNKYLLNFIRLKHSTKNTYGFKITFKDKIIAYLPDTGFAKKIKTNKGIYLSESSKGNFLKIIDSHQYIKDFYRNVNYAIININDLHYNRHSKFHLSGFDVLEIFKNSNLKKSILQHISPFNSKGEDNINLYKLFFKGEKYQSVFSKNKNVKIKI